jgi:WhiB family transcriptional regulator, redox-sensing transcriptional regulator
VTDWTARAACKGSTHLFFPEKGGDSWNLSRKAKAICAGCPVIAECAEAGLYEFHGIWAGMSRDERQAVRSSLRPEIRCGTASGYRRHRSRAEEPCEPCCEAQRVYERERRRRRVS